MTNEHKQAVEVMGNQVDRLENLVAGFDIPMPSEFHIKQLRQILPEIANEIKKSYITITGDNPWQ